MKSVVIVLLLQLISFTVSTFIPTPCLDFVPRGGTISFNGTLSVDINDPASWTTSVAIAGTPIVNGPVSQSCFLALQALSTSTEAPGACMSVPPLNSSSFCFTDPSTGSDANPCTESQPCTSVGGAITQGCVYLAMQSGVYSGASNRDLIAGQLRHIRGIGNVTIDLESSGRFIRFDDSVTSAACSLIGVTIINGEVSAPRRGGALRVEDVQITVVNSAFIDRTVLTTGLLTGPAVGGAIEIEGDDASPSAICGSRFLNNVVAATNVGGAIGGAIASFDVDKLLIWGNSFELNAATRGSIGVAGAGAIYFADPGFANMTVIQNSFCNNSVTGGNGVFGGSLVLAGQAFIIGNKFLDGLVQHGNVLVAGNSEGGAIYDFRADTVYVNNVFRGNSALLGFVILLGDADGGALSLRGSAIANELSGGNRFCNNTADDTGLSIFLPPLGSSISFELDNSTFQCTGSVSQAISPGTCDSGCTFLAPEDCSSCGPQNLTCEAIPVQFLTPTPSANLFPSFNIFFLSCIHDYTTGNKVSNTPLCIHYSCDNMSFVSYGSSFYGNKLKCKKGRYHGVAFYYLCTYIQIKNCPITGYDASCICNYQFKLVIAKLIVE